MNKAPLRNEVVDELHKLLLGPGDGENEVIEGRLNLRYFAGILFPQGEKRSSLASEDSDFEDEDAAPETTQSSDFSADSDNPLSMANEDLPSSVGLSFTVTAGASISVSVSAANYKNMGGAQPTSQLWHRSPYQEDTIEVRHSSSSPIAVLEGNAELHILRRRSRFESSSEIITVSLVNPHTYKEEDSQLKQASLRLYQVALSCRALTGKIVPYDSEEGRDVSFEDQILEMQYLEQPIFAVGHGASCSWTIDQDSDDVAVKVDYIPSAFVYRPKFDNVYVNGRDFEDSDIFSLSTLEDEDASRDELLGRLSALVSFYEDWISSQDKLCKQRFEEPHKYLISQMLTCANRMRRGLDLLANDDDCWWAFQRANEVMLRQRDQSDYLRSLRNDRIEKGLPWPISALEQIPATFRDFRLNKARWRPFQLAFSLMVIPDLETETDSHTDSDLVDLIWFSTGGGKTEAYMLVTAYELIRRRVRFGSKEKGLGTGVITRYTLRFLTADQFLRTVSLVCALEKVRIDNQRILGENSNSDAFTVGLFIGQDNSYGRINEAEKAIKDLNKNPKNVVHRFPVTECSECGTSLVPSSEEFESISDESERGKLFGYRKTLDGRIRYVCPNLNCLFSGSAGLPVSSIDEQIYDSPPSIVLGTVDKFAMLAFRGQAQSLFGSKKNLPPTLIIQDELHLISGPLGTIVSIYEAGFETVMKRRFNDHGYPQRSPKYIASSATVRDSDRQILRLMGKRAAVFPPRGIKSDDSFFATLDKNPDTARQYIGLMGQALRSTSAAHWSSAAVLQSVRSIAAKMAKPQEIDFLWTLLVYCNSKRELGLINAAVDSEISDRMKVYAVYQKNDPEEIRELSKREVSSTMVESIVDVRNDLSRPYNGAENSGCSDIVPATNMISVGVDIDRLGLMLVNGQPKTTAEYIQASSRVGRNPIGNGPGLVIALYSPAKPRDRSHYENFVGYHESIYRFVEPTSVTPGSERALERAVHAAITIAVRYTVAKMNSGKKAGSFDPSDPEISEVLKALKDRLLRTYEDALSYRIERQQIEDHFDQFVDHWATLAQNNEELHYEIKSPPPNRLLKRFDDDRLDGSRATMTSMRGVDLEIPMRDVRSRRKSRG